MYVGRLEFRNYVTCGPRHTCEEGEKKEKKKKEKKARLTNLEIYLVGCHVVKTKGSHALADTGPGQTINLPCHATIAAGPQRNSGPSSRLRK